MFPVESIAKPAETVTVNLSETTPVLVALKDTLLPLNCGVVLLHPEVTVSPAISFKVTLSLKVSVTFTWFAVTPSLVTEVSVMNGLAVSTITDKLGEAVED